MQDFQLFKAWIHAVIDRKIADAFGQDGLHEAVTELHLEEKLLELISNKQDQETK